LLLTEPMLEIDLRKRFGSCVSENLELPPSLVRMEVVATGAEELLLLVLLLLLLGDAGDGAGGSSIGIAAWTGAERERE